MKILLVIDHFGSGGAQRQIVELACQLKQLGHDVELFVYFPEHDFYRSYLTDNEIVIHECSSSGGFSLSVVHALARLYRAGNYDVVVSFLKSTNIYAELAKVFAPGTCLIVSERTNYRDDKPGFLSFLRVFLHVIANHVVANSQSQTTWLRDRWWLRKKTSCIYNGIDLEKFKGDVNIPNEWVSTRLLVVGRVSPEKNALNVIKGLDLLDKKGVGVPWVSWAGRRDSSVEGKAYCDRVDRLLEQTPAVAKHWQWLGERDDIPTLIQENHALLHASFYEGLPNVVCEALATGRPVLVSNVCDHPILVEQGKRGFLFDPYSPESISVALESMRSLTDDQWFEMSDFCRDYAKNNLSTQRMGRAYEDLFKRLLNGRKRIHA